VTRIVYVNRPLHSLRFAVNGFCSKVTSNVAWASGLDESKFLDCHFAGTTGGLRVHFARSSYNAPTVAGNLARIFLLPFLPCQYWAFQQGGEQQNCPNILTE
jgi:hypothetical protein